MVRQFVDKDNNNNLYSQICERFFLLSLLQRYSVTVLEKIMKM